MKNRSVPNFAGWGGDGGFTLIEIVLVLLVLSLGVALTVPALGPALESVRAEAAARRAASFLDDARRRAVLKRVTVTVTCIPDEGLLRVEGEDGAVFMVPERSEIVSCIPESLIYFPQGYASGGVVLLRDPRGREQRVTVGSFTGLTRVERVP